MFLGLANAYVTRYRHPHSEACDLRLSQIHVLLLFRNTPRSQRQLHGTMSDEEEPAIGIDLGTTDSCAMCHVPARPSSAL